MKSSRVDLALRLRRLPLPVLAITCAFLPACSLIGPAPATHETDHDSPSAYTEAPVATNLRAALQARFDEIHSAGSFPGATAGFALADGRSFAIATGISDRTTGRAMQTRDLMLQGSVGKTYVAAVALQLVHEGKLALDDKISKHLSGEPWFARLPNSADITVRMLMNHTSGLVRYEFKEAFTNDLTRDPDKVWRPEELVAYLLDEKAPFAAGQGWDYSDTNYIVLGMIIERITASKLNDEIARRLLKPLGLEHTRPSDSRAIPGLSQGYAGENNAFGGTDAMLEEERMVINPQFEWAGGGYASTAEDLARWGHALYTGRVFDAALLPQVIDGVDAPMLGHGVKYGLGVIVRDTELGPVWGHSGFFPGYLTEMRYFVDHDFCIAVQVNTSDGRTLGKPLGEIAQDLARIVLAAKPE
jgi:D-alanyl-D-alanine carboxypeptidase